MGILAAEALGGGGAALDLKFFVKLDEKVDSIHKAILAADGEIVFQMPIQGQLGGSGTIDNGAPQMGPPRGYCWSVRWLSVTGFSAGTAQVFINAIESHQPFTTAGFARFGKGEFILQPGERLTVTGSGLTGSMIIAGRADAFPYEYLTRYLGAAK